MTPGNTVGCSPCYRPRLRKQKRKGTHAGVIRQSVNGDRSTNREERG